MCSYRSDYLFILLIIKANDGDSYNIAAYQGSGGGFSILAQTSDEPLYNISQLMN